MQNQINITLTPLQQKIVRQLKGKLLDKDLAKKIGVGIGKLKANLILMGLVKTQKKPVAKVQDTFCWEDFKKSDIIFNAA